MAFDAWSIAQAISVLLVLTESYPSIMPTILEEGKARKVHATAQIDPFPKTLTASLPEACI